MEDIYFAYYRPSVWEANDACQTQLLSCYDAAVWWVRTRIPMWLFSDRADTMATKLIDNLGQLRREIIGISEQGRLGHFSASRGFLSRGNDEISDEDLKPQGYVTGIERGYSLYFKYLERLIRTATENDIVIYVYRFPWPEVRQTESEFQVVLRYYWNLIEQYRSDNFILLDEVSYWPNEFFVDPLHVNQDGAERLTRFVARKVVEASPTTGAKGN